MILALVPGCAGAHEVGKLNPRPSKPSVLEIQNDHITWIHALLSWKSGIAEPDVSFIHTKISKFVPRTKVCLHLSSGYTHTGMTERMQV